MVPLENKISFNLRINESPKLRAFHDLLIEKNISLSPNNNLSEVDELFLGIISSIQANNKEAFEQLYKKKSKSNPSKESPSPFVNDDFLIFCLIVGIEKFGIDKTWINKIISIRSRNGITNTLENILKENYYSKDNVHEIVLIYAQLVNPVLITNSLLNDAFKDISGNIELFESKSYFQISCALRAYDLIISLKEAPDGSEISLLRLFNSRFIKRSRILSWLLQLLLLLSFLFILLKLPVYSPETVALIKKYEYAFILLSALGFTFLGNQFDIIKKKSREITMRMLGYPKDLFRNIEKNDD
jgi:hypothetical protein